MPRRSLPQLLRSEFSGYSLDTLRQDVFAGLTVAAVALPLALAFGIASGATPAAGLVTAILAGLIIGGLGGAPYQISGPTGAMSAVLILLVQRYGLEGVWVAGLFSGILLLIIGLLRLGRFIAFVPAPVITGFTSGIAIIIAVGQIDTFLGIRTTPADTTAQKILVYLGGGFVPDWHSVAVGSLVVATMLVWPARWALKFPGSLCGIIIASLLAAACGWPVALIGDIPHDLILEDRLSLSKIPWKDFGDFLAPTLTITALGAVESLLCGAVGSKMTGVRLQANQELVAQGIGNIVIPFCGGVPATAAIARSSVGIKAGGRTRMVSIVQSLALLASMFLISPIMSKIPLAALSGVLMVTAWRMNEWEGIRFYFSRRFRIAIITFTLTLLATITLDLTQAIILGSIISAAVFMSEISEIDISVSPVEIGKLKDRGIIPDGDCADIKVAYLTGPLFFAAVGHFNEAFADLRGVRTLILSMRGVPLIDTSGLVAMEALADRLQGAGGRLLFAGLHPNVTQDLERSGVLERLEPHSIFWSADQAILAASGKRS